MIYLLLQDLGWDPFFENNYEPIRQPGLSVMRIAWENREKYTAYGELGEYDCSLSGRFRYEKENKGDFPAVGDWVAVSILPDEKKAVISAVLPRKSAFCRKVAGKVTGEQVVASNIDTVFIVMGLDLNFNLRRAERYLTMAWDSGALPVILLNKADICPETETRISEVEAVAPGVEVKALSAFANVGMDIFGQYTGKGKTLAFLGSSGVGKSTIINSLLGREHMKVNEVSGAGSRGRHTTTYRELIPLPGGGMVIDTPGMRELQVWGDEEALELVFDEIGELAVKCRFRDCAHESDPGCAVREALESGALSQKRFESYLKLKKEFVYLSKRAVMKPNALERSKWKEIRKRAKDFKKNEK